MSMSFSVLLNEEDSPEGSVLLLNGFVHQWYLMDLEYCCQDINLTVRGSSTFVGTFNAFCQVHTISFDVISFP